jgi:hypothetical protein
MDCHGFYIKILAMTKNKEFIMFKKTIDRMELIKQMRRMNRKKGKVIQPKNMYNRKDKSWKKLIGEKNE